MITNLLGEDVLTEDVLPEMDGRNQRAFFWKNSRGKCTATVRAVYARKDGTWFLLQNLKGELGEFPAIACWQPLPE